MGFEDWSLIFGRDRIVEWRKRARKSDKRLAGGTASTVSMYFGGETGDILLGIVSRLRRSMSKS